MTDDDQLTFTVTPYDEDAPVPDSTGQARQFSVAAAVPAGLWLIAGVVAVLANFLLVYRIHFQVDFGNGQTGQVVSFGFDGWGQHKVPRADAQNGFASLGSGARWGWAYSSCAALLLVSALWSFFRPRLRLWLVGPSEVALAALFGHLGTTVGLVLGFEPTIHQLSIESDQPTRFSWGWCWPAELVAFALGLIGWLWYRHLERPAAEPESSPSLEQSDSTYPQKENWFDEATDHPGTPRDLGPSPW